MKGLFITATDTDIGKTMITGSIAAALKQRGYKCGVFKPLASGAISDGNGKLVSEDANFLMKAAQIDESLRNEVNEICLKPPLTPAVAAKISGVVICMEQIISNLLKNISKYDLFLVEGVGGITAPLWENYLVINLMKRLNLPSIVISQPKLGAINHTVLTYEYAKMHNVKINGFILNRWNNETAGILEKTNIEYINKMTGLPLLGKMPIVNLAKIHNNLADIAEANLNINKIVEIMEGEN